MSSFKKTGDIKGNIESLIRNLKLIKYPSQTSFKILSSGNPEIYLPIIHYSLFNFSSVVAKFLSDKNYDMYAKNDLDFINTAFKCLMTLFNYKPDINTNQFFSNGYAEAKIILCKEIIDLVLQKDSELSKKKKGNKYSKDIYKNENNNNNSPRFHELNNSKNSNKKSKTNNNSNYINDNQENSNNDSDMNNINNNFNASLPMNNIPVPTPKPQYLISKNNSNMSNIQASVQSFKPKGNNQFEIYDSTQDYPLGGQNYESSMNNNSINNQNNSNNNSIDFNSVVKIITSLSESVSQMVNKIEKFKINIEDRLSKVEAEIVLIKNKQNYLESKINSNDNSNNNSTSAHISNNNYLYENQKNNNSENISIKENNISNYNINNNYNENNMNSLYANSLNKKNMYNKDEIKINNDNKINNNKKSNQIFTSFADNITLNPEKNYEENNNKIYYEQSTNNNLQNYTVSGYKPYPEENKVFNVFSYSQTNEDNYNKVNNNLNNNYNINNLNSGDNNIKNKYADIDKIIENSEKSFFNTQKLLEDYENKDFSKKK